MAAATTGSALTERPATSEVTTSVPHDPPKPWRWIKRLSLSLCLLAACWLIAANGWLWFFGESTVSRRPNKMQVTYDRAWSIFPGHLQVRGLRLSSQTRRNQWQLELDRASFQLSLARLLHREFIVSNLRGSGASFRLRNRPKKGQDLEAVAQSYPPIDAYTLSHAEPRPSPEKRGTGSRRPWHVSLSHTEIGGLRELWFDRVHTITDPKESRVSGSMNVVMRGTLSLQDVALHLVNAKIAIAGQPGAEQVFLDGSLSLAPTISRKLRDPATYLGLSAQLIARADVNSLTFLQTLLPADQQLTLEGKGTLNTKLSVKNGEVLEDSNFTIDAPYLRADVGSLAGEGRGNLLGEIEPTDSGRKLTLRIELENVLVKTAARAEELARARNFQVIFEGQDPRLGSALTHPRILVELPALEIPSLTAFKDLVPKGLGIEVLGGSAVAVTRIELSKGVEKSEFQLRANNAQLLFRGVRIEGLLEIAGGTKGDRADRSLALEGLTAKFQGTTKPNDTYVPPAPVAFDLRLGDTRLRLPPPGTALGRGLRLANGTIEIHGTVADLAWWETPIKGVDWLRLQGQADLSAKLKLVGSGRSTRLGAPSEIRLSVPELDAGLGKWRARSAGVLLGELTWSKGKVASQLSIELDNPTLSQKATDPLQLPSLLLQATGPSLAKGLNIAGVRFEVDAEPTDIDNLASLTAYLPTQRLALTGGRGTMQGSLNLTRDALRGEVRLSSDDASLELLGNPVSAAIDLSAQLLSTATTGSGYSLQGTTLRLTKVDFPNLKGQSHAWWAVLTLGKGKLIAGRPLHVDAQVELQMRDTEPIVHLVGESQRQVRWFSRLLEVQNVTGTARLILDQEGLRFQDLVIHGDGLEIRGRVDLREQTAALLLVQLHGLRAGFEILGDWRDVKVLRPGAWFKKRSAVWDGNATK